jgi:hypothetical protein
MKEIKVTVYGWWTAIPIWNKIKKPLAIALSGARRGLRRKDNGGDLINAQYKPKQNWHHESHPVERVYLNKNFL